jgi:succinate dehydrogenase / fumarate reductase iron-sulfur subunit
MTAGDPTAVEDTRTVRVRVFRFRRDDRASRTQEFQVPIGPRTTVLDALKWIQRHRDRTLAVRHSCLHASCGTCGMVVNGREALACVTPAEPRSDGVVTVQPLANIPVLTDLVVDVSSFIARFPPPHSIVRESEVLPQAERPEGHDAYLRFEDCIECGLCLSACPVAATDDTYRGPAALAYAQRMLEEPGGASVEQREALFDWADGDDAAWRCHAAFECTEACPSDVHPAERIMALRKLLRQRKDRPA